MKTKQVLFLCLFALAGAAVIISPQVMNVAKATPQEEATKQHGMMGGNTMDAESMTAMHEEMRQKMADMDARLDALVAEMNAASGNKREEAIAAVLTELVSQRRTMHGRMMAMQGRTMGHMMIHMKAGSPEEMMKSMSQCPMMKMMQGMVGGSEERDDGDHSQHHKEQ